MKVSESSIFEQPLVKNRMLLQVVCREFLDGK